MSIKSKIATIAIAALAVTSLAVGSASAKPKFHPVTGALIGAAVVGTAIAASQPHYIVHRPHRHCFMKPARDVWGNYLGYYVRQCHVHY
jgi:hypothetical protein